MPGGISQPHPFLSGPLLFLIMIIDIDKDISPNSKLVSFPDDTRVYSFINDIEKCDQLQIDFNSVYDWAHVNIEVRQRGVNTYAVELPPFA